MEKEVREKIERKLREFIGTKLVKIYRWQFMPGFGFEDADGNHLAFHAYSRCTITQGQNILLNSADILVPCEGVEHRDDDDYGLFECEYDMEYVNMVNNLHLLPLEVLSVELKDDGTVRMRLSNNCRFACVPWPDNKLEAWRVLRLDSDEEHLVYQGDGTLL